MGEFRTDAKSRAFLIFSKGMFRSRQSMAVLNRNSFSSLGDSEIAVVVDADDDDSSAFSKRQVVVGFEEEEEEEVDDVEVMIPPPDEEKDVNAVVVGVVIQPAATTTTKHKVLVGFKRAAGTAILLFVTQNKNSREQKK